MATATPTCKPADHARLRPQRSCSKKISVLAMRLKRLGHDADVGNSRPFHGIHDCCKRAEGHVLICAEENGLMLRVANFLPQLFSNLIDIDWVASQEHALLLVNADHQALFGDFFYGASFGN